MLRQSTALDHLVYGVPALEPGVDALAQTLGVRATAGGKHPGRGTHNALLSLGDDAYLELLAPDPDQEPPPRGLPFDLDHLREPHLVGWAIGTEDIDDLVAKARARGYDPGEIESMARSRPDGTRLTWRLTPFPSGVVVPFVIDWGATRHPSRSAPSGVTLTSLRIEHPDPGSVTPSLDALGVVVPIGSGPRAALIAELETPVGPRELR